MSDKAAKTIWIKWVRSGIGFPHQQKGVVRSLGLRRLNQLVERPDTPQIRGLVAKVPHLVSIVTEPPAAAGASLPEYILRPLEVMPAASPEPAAEGTDIASEAVSTPLTEPGDTAPEEANADGPERSDKAPNE
jgi:large subunit ribosomal protein L30